MTKLKEKVLELAEIAKECPERKKNGVRHQKSSRRSPLPSRRCLHTASAEIEKEEDQTRYL
jgi:hypothetical protein